ncbi:MAG TPA: ribonuclease P protein component [Candidatus Cloacimonas sp.]|jgi:ribonuclease P protein component|nr:ribonuclease P protein component [Candidatus Cloacimonadota bacterium]MDD4233892.1 ribonuclease P protein component [Candidatus Cloacimonadota bacterium]NLN35031.1 ribonuclease P protein component [Candidatus Cloacimonadota bacterium]HCM14825.1 ribonuclease P protein component [Candidatus Cloacimonas sp.]
MIRWIKAHQEYVEFSYAEKAKRTRYFYVPVLPDPQGPALGITISKKVSNAASRNRLKRRMRAWFREHQHILAPTCKMNFIARRGAADLSWQELCEHLGETIKCM